MTSVTKELNVDSNFTILYLKRIIFIDRLFSIIKFYFRLQKFIFRLQKFIFDNKTLNWIKKVIFDNKTLIWLEKVYFQKQNFNFGYERQHNSKIELLRVDHKKVVKTCSNLTIKAPETTC